jgi:hypothetical protein
MIFPTIHHEEDILIDLSHLLFSLHSSSLTLLGSRSGWFGGRDARHTHHQAALSECEYSANLAAHTGFHRH